MTIRARRADALVKHWGGVGIGVHAVRAHVKSVLAKLGAHSGGEAVSMFPARSGSDIK